MIQNPALYEKAKAIADATYKKPSAYKSSFLVKTYKELGGTYLGTKPKTGLTRWHQERWMDVGGKDYPVLRPSIKVSKDTPLTVQEIDPQNLKKQIALKQRIREKNLPPFSRNVRFNKKISPYRMPKKMKGEGFLDDLKDFGISAAKDVGRELIPIAKDYAISAAKSALTKGKGLYARGSGFTLSPAQARSLMAGKGIQLKPSMMGGEYELEMMPVMEKKMMRVFAKGKGMRVSSKNLKGVKKGGFVVPLLMTAARIAAPIIIEKLAEAGIKKLGGQMGGYIGQMPNLGAFGRGVGKSKPKEKPKEAEKIIEKARKARKARDEAPRQHGQLTPEDQALVASMQKEGTGLFAGGDVIQTGSPYQSTNSPAMSPFIPTRNPFGMYVPL